jgi:hypothetical protein
MLPNFEFTLSGLSLFSAKINPKTSVKSNTRTLKINYLATLLLQIEKRKKHVVRFMPRARPDEAELTDNFRVTLC